MEGGFQLRHENPKKKANFLSRLTFVWLIKLYYKGVRKGLEVADLYKVLTSDSSEKLGDKLEENWQKQVEYAKLKGRTPSLLKALTKTFFWGYMLHGLSLFVLHVVIKAYQPVVLAYLIGLFMRPEEEDLKMKMYISGSLMVLMSLVAIFMNHHTNFWQASVGMRLRIASSTLIYRKILRLSQKSLGQTAAGQVVNLLSNDVNRFDLVTIALHYLWIMPINSALMTYFIWQEVQISALAGVVSMALLSIPVQGYLGKITSQLRLKVAQRTDHRVKLMSEIIDGIQVIKMYAWEKPFEQIVKMARRKEIDALTTASYVRGIYLSCMVFVERTALFLTVVCYVLLGNVITADKVFSMAQFFNMLQLMMAIFYPMAITYGAESLVAVRRLQDFLMMEEMEEPSIQYESSKGIKLVDVDASWVGGTPNLENINIEIPPGTLCAIVGPVGAGKSSILQLLLGELKPTVGTIKVGGVVSYSSQEPWLFVSSVRNNILFGQQFDKKLYRNVVKVCALEKDFDQFPQRDRTMVGERGVSLSGGQRARINLARAVYRDADIYLLDDPLSAVDTHVGKHLFEECIMHYLRGKTRVLVTHQLQYLKKADLIIVINDGRIEAQGTFEELCNSELDFTKMLVAADETSDSDPSKKSELERRTSVLSSLSIKSDTNDDELEGQVEEERIPTNTSALADYFSAAGNICVFSVLVIILILGQVACSAADYWITFWTQQEAVRHLNTTRVITEDTPVLERVEYYGDGKNLTESNQPYYTYTKTDDIMSETVIVDNRYQNILRTDMAIYIYSGIIALAIVVTMMRSFLFFKIAMNASKNLHKKMFNALLQAPMRFFDTNPSGRVLNRFSKDMGAIDEILPRTLLEAIQITLVMTGILVMVIISNYYMIVAIIVLGALFWKLRTWYILTAKDVKHLEGITKSPVFSHLNSSINGLITIRASKAQGILKKEFDAHQDVHTSAWYLTLTCIFSFGLWLDMICVAFLACIIYSFIILTDYTEVNGSLVGLAISQSIILTGMLQYGIKQSAEVINQLTSVERIMQYTKLEREGPFETPAENKVTLPWPNKGLIEFKHLYLRYALSDPPVLKDLNITILPGQKVGIVGRTGAGKSSLISALFRLTNLEGSILIDGVNVKQIGLHDLRRKISIIPQEPVLFSATLRYNLDPFYEFDDDRLWNALEEVELKDAVTTLDAMVMHGGANFSLGQRQLLCLARAILRNNRILVLDEATANVDPRTDGLIQATIREKFKHCTVLTIAHRLNTIMDSDKVLVMDSGCVVEFDHPHLLLQNEDGYFHKMVLQTGSSMTNQLKAIAKSAYDSSIK